MYSTNIWHPCSQMKDYETFSPLRIAKAEKEYLYLEDGTKIIDAISSWWCKSFVHNHPKIQFALKKQLETLEHTILANTTNSTIEKLSQRLCKITSMDKTLFASDGSCAIEIAMKMATHARTINGQKKNNYQLRKTHQRVDSQFIFTTIPT